MVANVRRLRTAFRNEAATPEGCTNVAQSPPATAGRSSKQATTSPGTDDSIRTGTSTGIPFRSCFVTTPQRTQLLGYSGHGNLNRSIVMQSPLVGAPAGAGLNPSGFRIVKTMKPTSLEKRGRPLLRRQKMPGTTTSPQQRGSTHPHQPNHITREHIPADAGARNTVREREQPPGQPPGQPGKRKDPPSSKPTPEAQQR